MAQEIGKKNDLLKIDGTLKAEGFLKKPLLRFNREDVKKPGRLKEWDSYYIYDERYGLLLTLAHSGNLAVISATVIDFEKDTHFVKKSVKLFPKNKDFMSHDFEGVSAFKTKDADFMFENKKGVVTLKGNFTNFYKVGHKKHDLEFDLTIGAFCEEGAGRAVEFGHGNYVYDHNAYGKNVSGNFSYKERKWSFSHGTHAIFKRTRGQFCGNQVWYCAGIYGKSDGHDVALNIAKGLGNDENACENMFFYDGVAHLVGGAKIYIRRSNYRNNYLGVWTFYTDDGRVELIFEPDQDVSQNGLLFGYHKVLGRFSGKLISEDGSEITIDNQSGFAARMRSL